MKKQDMIKELAARNGITQVEAKRIFDATFDELTTLLGHGDSVNLPTFGTFSVKYHKKRKGFNPSINKFMMLPQKLKTKFKSSELLKSKLNGLPVESDDQAKPSEPSEDDTVAVEAEHSTENVAVSQTQPEHSAENVVIDQTQSEHSAENVVIDQTQSEHSTENVAADQTQSEHSTENVVIDQTQSEHSTENAEIAEPESEQNKKNLIEENGNEQ